MYVLCTTYGSGMNATRSGQTELMIAAQPFGDAKEDDLLRWTQATEARSQKRSQKPDVLIILGWSVHDPLAA